MTNPKPWLWLLVASLALNVYFGVVMGTHFLRGPKRPPRPEMMILTMADTLPEADARILRQAYEAHRHELPADHGPDASMDRMHRALAAEPFDRDAFLAAAGEFRADQDRMHRVLSDILAEALPRMSPAGRKRLADRPPPGDAPPPPR